ncbi:MAG TPA: TolC family protein [Sphingomonas sp.]|nr:TolC family protein [Sphingomonas sp.]
MKRQRLLMAALFVGGCAHYTSLPLPREPALPASLPALPAAALTVAQVTALAVERSPDLVAARTKRGVAQAQLAAAGVLPNPSLTGAFLPLISGVGTVPAWNVGLTQDIKALIVYRPRLRAARDAAGQVEADLLWQEWQTAGEARRLAVDLILGEHNRALLTEADRLLAHRYALMQKALAARDVTLTTAAPSASAFQSARANLLAAEQHQLELRHRLNALLGIAADAVVPLADHIDLPPFDAAAAEASLTRLADRRPDLLALRLGYAAADEDLRGQILSQFPDLVLGGSASSDNSNVINAGPTATIGVPIFDRNQGHIAVARATRVQLHAEYTARLAAVTGEVGAMLGERAALTRQLAIVRGDLPKAKAAADRAAQAFNQSALDERSYVDLITAYFAKEQEIMTLETALADQEVAIDTLMGAGLPAVDTLPPVEGARP